MSSLPPCPRYPAEALWRELRQRYLDSNRVFTDMKALAEAFGQAWYALIANPARLTRLLSLALFHRVFPTQFCDPRRAAARTEPPGDAMWDGGVMRMSDEDGPGMPGHIAW
jgi:hypothetical protein